MDLLLPFCIACVQVPGALLRYAPFASLLGRDGSARLFRCYAALFFVEFLLLCRFTASYPVTLETYKIILFLAKISYFTISCFFLRGMFYQNFFIFGLQGIYTFIIHSFVAFAITNLGLGADAQSRMIYQSAGYILLFFACVYPVWKNLRKSFTLFMLTYKRYYWNVFWFVPTALGTSNVLLTMLNKELINTWQELASRVITGIAAFSVWRMVILDFKELEEKVELVHINKLLNMRQNAISEQAELIKENEKRMRILRHDMRHNIRILSYLIESGDRQAALEFLRNADQDVLRGQSAQYCEDDNINAALIVYLNIAKERGAVVECRADVPRSLGGSSRDIAILTANLLENAARALEKEPANRRRLSVKLMYRDHKLGIEILNSCTRKIAFSQDGYPIAFDEGHGTGFSSIRAIVEKYGAEMICEQRDGLFSVTCLFYL